MLVQINTDRNIDGTVEMITHFTQVIKDGLERFEEDITRVEVHLSDENGSKEVGDDKKCVLEARLKGSNPLVVTTLEATIHQAVKSAAEKMQHLLEKTFEKKRVQS